MSINLLLPNEVADPPALSAKGQTNGKGVLHTLIKKTAIFPARYERLAAICRFVTDAAKAAGLDARAVDGVEMAVDEACTNIIRHAYGGEGRGDIECTYVIAHNGLMVMLRDYGQPFDPTSVPEPDIDASPEDCKPGGLGLYFIHQLMDTVCFEFTADSGNILTMVKHKKTPSCGWLQPAEVTGTRGQQIKAAG